MGYEKLSYTASYTGTYTVSYTGREKNHELHEFNEFSCVPSLASGRAKRAAVEQGKASKMMVIAGAARQYRKVQMLCTGSTSPLYW